MSDVYFADARVRELRPNATIPAKFRRLLKRLDLVPTVKDRTVAVKMHLGGNVGYTTIRPVFVRALIEELKEAGAKSVSVMDGSVEGAAARGYTEEILGAPVVSCFGWSGKYLYRKKIGFDSLQYVHYGGNAWDADVFIDFSHIKGHGNCGFGGAIKNIAMGCVPPQTRGGIHRLEGGIVWNARKCIHCNRCIEECPNHANSFTKEGEYRIFFHDCTYCQHCILACPEGALTLVEADFDKFQEGMARVADVFLKHFRPERLLFINLLMDITIFCDCWGMSTPSLVPDIGILAGRNIVAVETASLDKIKVSKLMPEGLPAGRKLLRRKGHLFERIHGKDPYVQVRKLDELGFGPADYRIRKVN